jgi:hypothetical protein
MLIKWRNIFFYKFSKLIFVCFVEIVQDRKNGATKFCASRNCFVIVGPTGTASSASAIASWLTSDWPSSDSDQVRTQIFSALGFLSNVKLSNDICIVEKCKFDKMSFLHTTYFRHYVVRLFRRILQLGFRHWKVPPFPLGKFGIYVIDDGESCAHYRENYRFAAIVSYMHCYICMYVTHLKVNIRMSQGCKSSCIFTKKHSSYDLHMTYIFTFNYFFLFILFLSTILSTGGRCYDHNFLLIFANFWRKNGVFLKNQCYDQIFS